MQLKLPLRQKKALEEFTRRLKSSFPDASVFLFGSLARGDWLEDSDVDVLVVTDYLRGLKPWERSAKLRAYAPRDVAFDIIVLTRDEFKEMRSLYEPLVEVS
ncbi:MAG: nucleotidyltransferase domain-containing protein [Candidatus Verstraetearchaeota archaeon]|nr:nucleotidyltransferase domain-containing protein [Candidatus Verstraetearchaeota archaeon]